MWYVWYKSALWNFSASKVLLKCYTFRNWTRSLQKALYDITQVFAAAPDSNSACMVKKTQHQNNWCEPFFDWNDVPAYIETKFWPEQLQPHEMQKHFLIFQRKLPLFKSTGKCCSTQTSRWNLHELMSFVYMQLSLQRVSSSLYRGREIAPPPGLTCRINSPETAGGKP